MLIFVAFAIAFFAITAGALWAGIGRKAAIGLSAAICLSFAGGALVHPFEGADATAPQADAQVQPVTAPATSAATGTAGAAVAAGAAGSPLSLRSLFSGDVATLAATTGTAPGSIDDVHISPDKRFAFVMGWIVDPATKAPAHGVVLIVDGRLRFDATPYYGVSRPDVAKALNSPNAGRAGYAGAVVSLAGLTPGPHVLASAAITSDNHYELVAQQHSFTL